jgi:hypothetical protein
MAPGHQWSGEEEVALFEIAEEFFDGIVRFHKNTERDREIAQRLNAYFLGKNFNARMVKTKISFFREKWVSQVHAGDCVLVFAPLLILSLPHCSI